MSVLYLLDLDEQVYFAPPIETVPPRFDAPTPTGNPSCFGGQPKAQP
ncbi:MAG: hypothetical protein LBU32_33005 [Clostridiales bacterium]|nr:hypothetical protein [Clostridiales bacterium]